jgi:hypothetical protein
VRFPETIYPAATAKAAVRTVFAASRAHMPTRKSPPLMVVPARAPPYDDNFTANLNFYKANLDITLDPEGRGYGTYT